MKKCMLSLLLLANLSGISRAQDETTSLAITQQIDSLITKKHFFAARNLYNERQKDLTEFDQLLSGASLDNVFNRLEASNKKIEALFSRYEKLLTDSSKYYLLNIRQMNYSKLYEYKKAHETINVILEKYSRLISEEEIEDLKNTNLIWKSLADQPKQTITINGHTVLKVKRDKARLSNLEVKHGKKKIDFIFDTGANISTVTESTAKKFNMKMMDVQIDVTSITGIKVKSGIAVCPELKIGEIVVKNAIFLVFPDKALAVPQIRYQINGIIGFPIIEAFNEVQITQQGEFIIPGTQTEYHNQNMALDFFTPLIELNGESYSFDSGADETMLYYTYYNKHKAEIEGKYKEEEYEFGGAGGKITKKGYFIPFNTIIDGKDIILEKVIVFPEKVKDTELYGNIGQDLIRKYAKMTLNFDSMFIKFDE